MDRSTRLIAYMVVALLLTTSVLGSFPTDAFAVTTDELYFTILHTNDEHSALLPSPLIDNKPGSEALSQGGFARLSQVVKQIRAAKAACDEPVLLLSGGDYLGGSPFAWLALDGKAAELTLMQELGYDVVTIGNHEYDFGPNLLADYLRAAGYPQSAKKTAIVASNMQPPAGHPLDDLGIRTTLVKQLSNGLKVGFFGLLGEDAEQVAPYAEPVTFADRHETARQAVAELQAAGAQVIVGITHLGLDEDQELAKALPEIDVIIGGHCHTALHQPVMQGKTIIVQAGELLDYLGMVELAYDPEGSEVRLRNPSAGYGNLLPLDKNIPLDSQMERLVDTHVGELNDLIRRLTSGQFAAIDETVLYSDFIVSNKPELQESPFGNFVADAMRWAGEQATGKRVDFAFQANGVIRGSITPGTQPDTAGQVALLDLVDLVGLGSGPDGRPGYPMVSIYFTGEEVRRILEVSVLLSELMGDTYFLQASGLRMTYDPKRAVLATVPIKNIPIPTTRAVLAAERYTGEGIPSTLASWAPLNRGDEQLYHVVSDYYLAAFLPMVGDILPSLGLVMKDQDGKPIADVNDAIIYRNTEEVKVWQAVLEYAASLPRNAAGFPQVPEYYQETAGRLNMTNTIPLIVWPILFMVALLLGIIWLVRRRRRTARVSV